jgi:hypothetical protein
MSRFAWRIALRGGLALGASVLFGGAGAVPPDFAPNPSVGWVAFSGVFMPPSSGPGPMRDDPAHRRVSNDDFRASGAQPTFPMADLSNPILQPWVRENLRQRTERILSGKPAFSRNASCWPAGVPAFLLYPVQPVYFVQSPKEVLMIWQADHQVRHVFLNIPHAPRVKLSDYGESIGHYEGDALVVDTIGLNPRTFIDGYQTPHTGQLHVIERFHMIDGGKTLEVNLHVEDPGAFTTPWDAIQRYHRVEPSKAEPDDPFNLVSSTSAAGPIIEASCAENPNSLFGAEALPVPQALKPDF